MTKSRARKKLVPAALLLVLATFALRSPTPAVSEGLPKGLERLSDRKVFEPQLIQDADGTLLLWREKGDKGSDLFLSRQNAEGAFTLPVQVNDLAGTVGSYPLDELRAASAQGPNGELAISWGAAGGEIRVAISSDGGRSFAPSLRLDQADKPAYRGFPAIAFDADGSLHAVWIDARFAPKPGAEEPADLFYAKLSDAGITEVNLTEEQDPSICGCCRLDLVTASDGVRATFRNTTADGYRDIFTLSGEPGAGFTAPRQIGTPLWELNGCPMSGPLSSGEEALFPDGSGGRKILMSGREDNHPAEPVFGDHATTEWSLLYPPRPVATEDGSRQLLLVPGRPTGRLIERVDGEWKVLSSAVPKWATSATYSDGSLLVVGSPGGALQFATLNPGS